MTAQEGKLGVWGLAPGKIFHDHALQIVGKRPILGQFTMKEAKDHDWWCSFPGKVLKRDFDITTINDMDYFEQQNIKSNSLINSGSVLTYTGCLKKSTPF